MAEMSRETQATIAASSMFPGFRFSPTDEELISYYLKKKLEASDKCVEVISEVEICKFEPCDLPAKSVIPSENEWYFFSPRGRKYPNGSQSKRATESGYWKATGKERNVKSGSVLIGTKRTLVFHIGRAPKGERTEWIMHEYCMSGMSQDSLVVCRLRKNSEFQLNDSPRQSPLSGRHLSTENDSNFSLSEVRVEQSAGTLEGAKAVQCCSKECSSSYNSHSVEQQIDSGSESDQILTNKFSKPGSSSHQGCDDEEWYAEILKDDIVDLDKSLLPSTPDLLPLVVENSEDERWSQQPVQAIPFCVHPFQGTAERRIRWSQQKPENYHAEPVEVEANNKNYSIEKFIGPNSERQPKCLLSLLSDQRVNHRCISAVFIILILLVLFLSLGVAWQVTSHTRL